MRVLCWLIGHGWDLVLTSVGRTYSRCRRCGLVTYR
jgi:hypothetical protein